MAPRPGDKRPGFGNGDNMPPAPLRRIREREPEFNEVAGRDNFIELPEYSLPVSNDVLASPAPGTPLDLTQLKSAPIMALSVIARDLGIPDYSGLIKQDLIFKILEHQSATLGYAFASGVLEVLPDGYGFLRSPKSNFLPGPDDIYVSPSQVKRFGLRKGHIVSGQIRPPKDTERFFALLRVEAVNFENPDETRDKILFDNLTPLFPTRKINLETRQSDPSLRIMDLYTPIGMG